MKRIRVLSWVLGWMALAGIIAACVWAFQPLATLLSLRKLNDYPLYRLDYYGDMQSNLAKAEALERFLGGWQEQSSAKPQAGFACSLFFSAADPADMQYGRNFDWQYSPALVVVVHQPGGSTSISIANTQWMGFSVQRAAHLDQLPLLERLPLLASPALLTDGMNNRGLVVGMAAVPERGELFDTQKPTLDSLMAMRALLDTTASVPEALDLLAAHNIDMGSGPSIHYLIADSSGQSALVEITADGFFQSAPTGPYQTATNHYLTDPPEQQPACPRLEAMNQTLQAAGGRLAPGEAMRLLQQVSQANTQWSVVYHNTSGQMEVVMDLRYDLPLTLRLNMR
ncbi:MAG: linear amide C-N hydrolase [Chloroflexi bacterium]|nr:linear amide C-N hydrolase [Chloroflexota bacterium]